MCWMRPPLSIGETIGDVKEALGDKKEADEVRKKHKETADNIRKWLKDGKIKRQGDLYVRTSYRAVTKGEIITVDDFHGYIKRRGNTAIRDAPVPDEIKCFEIAALALILIHEKVHVHQSLLDYLDSLVNWALLRRYSVEIDAWNKHIWTAIDWAIDLKWIPILAAKEKKRPRPIKWNPECDARKLARDLLDHVLNDLIPSYEKGRYSKEPFVSDDFKSLLEKNLQDLKSFFESERLGKAEELKKLTDKLAQLAQEERKLLEEEKAKRTQELARQQEEAQRWAAGEPLTVEVVWPSTPAAGQLQQLLQRLVVGRKVNVAILIDQSHSMVGAELAVNVSLERREGRLVAEIRPGEAPDASLSLKTRESVVDSIIRAPDPAEAFLVALRSGDISYSGRLSLPLRAALGIIPGGEGMPLLARGEKRDVQLHGQSGVLTTNPLGSRIVSFPNGQVVAVDRYGSTVGYSSTGIQRLVGLSPEVLSPSAGLYTRPVVLEEQQRQQRRECEINLAKKLGLPDPGKFISYAEWVEKRKWFTALFDEFIKKHGICRFYEEWRGLLPERRGP